MHLFIVHITITIMCVGVIVLVYTRHIQEFLHAKTRYCVSCMRRGQFRINMNELENETAQEKGSDFAFLLLRRPSTLFHLQFVIAEIIVK